MFLWAGLVICTMAIVYSGTRLSKYGDIIAEKTGMGRTWIGMVLMAAVTSLPELATGISSVTYSDVPDIAIGDVLGSCVFNMLILGILDIFYRQIPISTRAHRGHILSGSTGILLMSIVAIGIFAAKYMSPIGWIGQYSILFVVIYLIIIRLVFSYERRHIAKYIKSDAIELRYEKMSTLAAVIGYVLNAVIVVIAAVFLPEIGKGIAEVTGLGQTFVGNVFIAISTSLPEFVISVSAIKLNALDLAVGNLFGSNIFNILIIAIDDVFFIKGPILSFVSLNHILSALSAIAMTSIAILGLTYRAERKQLFLAWDSLGIVLIYMMNLMLLYMLRQ